MSYQEILVKAQELSQVNDFHQVVNTRLFELEITRIASAHKVNSELNSQLLNGINEYLGQDIKIAFILFFVLFTIQRRQNYGNIFELVDEYEEHFRDYEIVKHIRLMAALVKLTNIQAIYREIRRATVLMETPNPVCDFTKHTGFINAYVSLVCKYFEYELDARDEDDNIKLLGFALHSINQAIDIETKEHGSKDKVYNKFYLNRGRLLILLKKYSKGEDDIQKAIELLPETADRASTVNEYNQFLVKSSIIRSYDLNEEKVKDLDKVKASNYKSIALMTTLLGFLLGTINIFTTVTDRFTLLVLMLGYCGLLLVLVGTILIGFTLNFKERRKRIYIYDICLILVGIAIFLFTMVLINRG